MTEKLEIRSFAEQPTIDDERSISGYAVVFGVRSEVMYDWIENRRFVEIIEPGAITDELLSKSDVRALIEHNNERLLARSNCGKGTLSLWIDERGLNYKFTAPNTTDGNDAVEMIRRGDIAGSSFAFRTKVEDVSWTKDASGLWLRSVKKIHYMRDVTITADPAYTQTSVNVRSIADLEIKKDINEDVTYKANINKLRKLI